MSYLIQANSDISCIPLYNIRPCYKLRYRLFLSATRDSVPDVLALSRTPIQVMLPRWPTRHAALRLRAISLVWIFSVL